MVVKVMEAYKEKRKQRKEGLKSKLSDTTASKEGISKGDKQKLFVKQKNQSVVSWEFVEEHILRKSWWYVAEEDEIREVTMDCLI